MIRLLLTVRLHHDKFFDARSTRRRVLAKGMVFALTRAVVVVDDSGTRTGLASFSFLYGVCSMRLVGHRFPPTRVHAHRPDDCRVDRGDDAADATTGLLRSGLAATESSPAFLGSRCRGPR